jgi:hypothetical protein
MRIHLLKPRGCGCFALIALLLTLLSAVPLHRQWRLRHHHALLAGLRYVDEQPETADKIGRHANPGPWIEGSINEGPSRGEADFRLQLRGAQGSAILYLQMTKDLGDWQVQGALLELENGERVDISPPQDDNQGPAQAEPDTEKAPVKA